MGEETYIYASTCNSTSTWLIQQPKHTSHTPHTQVHEAEIFSTGVVVLTSDLELIAVEDLANPMPTPLASAQFGGDCLPTCMAVIEPQHTGGKVEVLVVRGRGRANSPFEPLF